MSSFKDKSAQALLDLASNVASVVGTSPTNPYGIDPLTIQGLTSAETGLTTAMGAQNTIEIAAKAATATKSHKKTVLAANLAAIQATVVADPAVSDQMLIALGFSPRRRGSTTLPKTPVQVTGLTADPSATGNVRLAWNREGNAQGTMFVVETSEDGASWTMIKSTTRASYTAEGFAPGEAAWFRVSAATSVAASTPSLPVAIYAPATPARPVLKIAA